MPFTTYHLASGFLFGYFLRRHLHWPTLIIVTTILVDIEPVLVMTEIIRDYSVHGLTHTVLASLILGCVSGLLMYFVNNRFKKFFRQLYLVNDKKYQLRGYVLAGISGWFLHIAMDTPIYPDIRPFEPFNKDNPFLIYQWNIGTEYIKVIYDIVLLAGFTIYLVYFYTSSSNVNESFIARFQLGTLMLLEGMIVFPLGLKIEGSQDFFALILSQLFMLSGAFISVNVLRELKLLSKARYLSILILMTIAMIAYNILGSFSILIPWIAVTIALILLRKPLLHIKLKIFLHGSLSIIDIVIVGWTLSIVLIGIPVFMLAILALTLNAQSIKRYSEIRSSL
jgi:hypothetical protein